jgi:hypothetical protein
MMMDYVTIIAATVLWALTLLLAFGLGWQLGWKDRGTAERNYRWITPGNRITKL